jgi:hypothetical protein
MHFSFLGIQYKQCARQALSPTLIHILYITWSMHITFVRCMHDHDDQTTRVETTTI